MSSIEAALGYIDPLKAGENINHAKIAERFGVNRSTLSKPHRGVQGSREDQ
jgi:ParB-like chromosome segregation protein Spo0J